MGWEEEYRRRLVSAEDAARAVKSHDHILVPGWGSAPLGFLGALMGRRDELEGVRICHPTAWGPLPYFQPEYATAFRYKSPFVSPSARRAMEEGRVDFIPLGLGDLHRLLLGGVHPVDLAVLHLSPPDRHGFCSTGGYIGYMKAAAEAARLVVGEVNDQMPRTYGDTLIHISELDYILEVSRPLVEAPPVEVTEMERRIGEHVAALVEDGATLQIGRGAIPMAVASLLADKKDLGVHSEMASDWVVDLAEKGALTGRRKSLHPGKIVTGFLDGSQRLYRFVHENPMVELYRTEYVNDPCVIGRNDNMVALNGALQVDLTGQINAESIGTRVLSGVGGQLDFALGAMRSKSGKYIVALPSTAVEGQISRIVAQLDLGAAVTVPRTLAHLIVTEYGVADLKGKTLQERARALIAIAHPKFRDTLWQQARERRDLFL